MFGRGARLTGFVEAKLATDEAIEVLRCASWRLRVSDPVEGGDADAGLDLFGEARVG